MCEFCHQHGEGKKWYLQAKNYSQDLQSDLLRRMKLSREETRLLIVPPGFVRTQFQRLEQRPKWLRNLLKPYLSRYLTIKQKKSHYGQVVPIEDVSRIFDMVNTIDRFACMCRQSMLGREERYCYGLSMGPPPEWAEKIAASYQAGPDIPDREKLSKDEALASFRKHESEGCLHTVWTLPTPFIVGFCNCDRPDCGVLRQMFSGGLPMLFKAEYISEVNQELCNGCRQCMRVCQYGAIIHSAAQGKVIIDPRRCAGCGICRATCAKDAITMHDRSASQVAADIW